MAISKKRTTENKKEDRGLVTSALDGDQQAFERLMQKYRKSVYYVIYRTLKNPEDAEDLTQETFTKAFSKLESFDPKYSLNTWLGKIASNSAIDFIRRRKMQTLSIHAQVPGSEDMPNPLLQLKDGNLIPDETLLKKQRKEYLELAISQLPERYRKLVELRYFDELSYEEVAVTLQIPLGTVKAQLHRARELLSNALSAMQANL